MGDDFRGLRPPAPDALMPRREAAPSPAPRPWLAPSRAPAPCALPKPPALAPFAPTSPLSRRDQDDAEDDGEDAVPTRLMPKPVCVPLWDDVPSR